MGSETPRLRSLLLLGSVFAVAAAGLVYELIGGALGTYLLGGSTLIYSVVIGVFLASMGLGAAAAQAVREDLLGTFVRAETLLAFVGGTSAFVVLASHAAAGLAAPTGLALLVAVGALVGLEVPLLLRLVGERFDLRIAASSVLSLDYAGALLGSLLVPLLLLPLLGPVRAAALVGLLNLAVASLAVPLLPPPRLGRWIAIGLAGAVLSLLLATGAGLTTWLEDRLYDDTVVLADSTRYQRIVVTRFRDDTRLFLDGHLQFSSRDEARYHEPLVHPAMAAASSRRRVLLLGGGDGMAVREVLRWQPGAVTLVDLDPELVAWFRDRDELAALNGLALRDARVSAVHRDAVRFLEDDPGGWDVIVADLPDPHDAALSRLYAAPFYRLALSRLAEGGAFVTQATSPFYARDAWDCLVATVRGEAGARPVRPYLSHVPSFGLWGFVLVGDEPRAALPQGLRYLDDAVLRASFVLPRDIAPRDAAPNGLADARLARLYQRGWREWNDR